MSRIEPVAGASLDRSIDVSMDAGSRSGIDGRFRAMGGELGVVIGVASVASARLATETFGPVSSSAGADPGLAGPACIAVIALAVALAIGIPMVFAGSNPAKDGRVRLGLIAALVMSARIASHEVAIRATLPDLGGGRPIIVVRGVLLEDPVPVPVSVSVSGSGSESESSQIDRRPWRSSVRVESASHPMLEGRRLPVSLPVSLSGSDARLVTGARVVLLGRIAPVPAPANPGERDRRRGSRDTIPARFVVTSPASIMVCGYSRPSSLESLRRGWRNAAGEVDEALSMVGARSHGLIAAVLAGDRRRLAPSVREAAEDAGIAPMLAISGWHLALVGAIVAAIVGRHRPVGRIITLGAVMIFMLAVVPGPSVRRAATMALISGSLVLGGRRPRPLPVVAIGSAILVWMDPRIIESIGFVLSVVATFALVAGTGPARIRWFGSSDRIGRRRRSWLRDPLAGAATASIVAWSVSGSIVLASFGRLSWTAVPAMILVAPVFVVLMASGMVSIVAVILTGDAPDPLLLATGLASDGLVRLIEGMAEVAPVTRWTLPPGMVTPAILVAVCLLIAFGRPSIGNRWAWRFVAMAILSSSIVTLRFRETGVSPGFIRVDAIAVGDGTSLLVRGSEGAVLVDAGSSSIQGVGRRILLPALNALGVRELDAVIVTHANLDHFGEVGIVVRAIPVERIVVSPGLLSDARRLPESVIGVWLGDMHDRGVMIDEASRGDRLRFRDLDCRVLHPLAGEPCRSVNDSSLVATMQLVDDPGARPSLLICGDIQDEGMARVMTREPDLSANIMELPHHGSWRPIAATLLDRVDPVAIVQSTGPDRWWMDRWRDACGPRRRGITARDGLVSFEVNATGWVRSLAPRRSEETEAGLVTSILRTTVGSRPDDHDGPVDPSALGEGGVEDSGHAFEKRRAR